MNKKIIYLSLILLVFVLSGLSCSLTTKKKIKDGGIFISLDGGESWEQKAFIRSEKKTTITIGDFSIMRIVFDPADNNTIYISTKNNGIYKTVDSGEVWFATSISSGNYPTLDIDNNNTQIVYTSSGSNIYKTYDGGENWDIIYTDSTGAQISSLLIDYYNSDIVYASTSVGNIYKSFDGGENWLFISNLENPIQNLYIDTQDSRTLYAITRNKGIFRSLDGGATWVDINEDFKELPGTKDIGSFAISTINSNIIYLGTKYGLFRSENKGTNWISMTTLVPFNTIKIAGISTDFYDPNIIYFHVGKLIHKTRDGGTNWKVIEDFPSQRNISQIIQKPGVSEVFFAGTILTE